MPVISSYRTFANSHPLILERIPRFFVLSGFFQSRGETRADAS